MNAKTMDELCKETPGSFQKFIKEKEAFLEAIENERRERIRAAKQAAKELSWAA